MSLLIKDVSAAASVMPARALQGFVTTCCLPSSTISCWRNAQYNFTVPLVLHPPADPLLPCCRRIWLRVLWMPWCLPLVLWT